jgi:hypothetical protein
VVVMEMDGNRIKRYLVQALAARPMDKCTHPVSMSEKVHKLWISGLPCNFT